MDSGDVELRHSAEEQELIASVRGVADVHQADVLLYNGQISNVGAEQVFDALHAAPSEKSTVVLVLVTNGGDGSAAYRISRYLQRQYKQIIAIVPGTCWSAGTLVIIGAHQLVIGELGTLGPLDVQIQKPDELWEVQSGLTGSVALDALREQAFRAFEEVFLDLKVKSGGRVRLRTAMETAISFVSPLFAPIFGQIDPMKLAEDERAMRIADHYGRRLDSTAKNLRPSALERILRGYPSHDTVIDFEESEQLFVHVRTPNEMEVRLFAALGDLARTPTPYEGLENPLVALLSALSTDKIEEPSEHEKLKPRSHQRTDGPSDDETSEQSVSDGNGLAAHSEQTGC